MAVQQKELEGTWEEILSRSQELAGRRLRVTILDPEEASAEAKAEARRERMLAWLERRKDDPLTDEEKRILDEFPAFRKEHPIRFRRFDLDDET